MDDAISSHTVLVLQKIFFARHDKHMEVLVILVCLCLFAVFVYRQHQDDDALPPPLLQGAQAMGMSVASFAALMLMYAILWLAILQFLRADADTAASFPYREILASIARASVPLFAAVLLTTLVLAVAVPPPCRAITAVVGVTSVVSAWRLRG
jgi:hypothetical protein